jgi:hypothetical protein
MNEGKMEYAKFEKVGLNNCGSVSQRNIFYRAHYGHISYEEVFGCYSSRDALSHVQE